MLAASVDTAELKEKGSGQNSLEALVDADAIFSYQCVRRMNENAEVSQLAR